MGMRNIENIEIINIIATHLKLMNTRRLERGITNIDYNFTLNIIEKESDFSHYDVVVEMYSSDELLLSFATGTYTDAGAKLKAETIKRALYGNSQTIRASLSQHDKIKSCTIIHY